MTTPANGKKRKKSFFPFFPFHKIQGTAHDMKRKTKNDLAREVEELTQRLDITLAELSDLRQENATLKARLLTETVQLAEARDAVQTIHDRLRTATACRCRMIEVTAGDWRLYQTIDCPVHRQHTEVIF